MDRLNRNGDGGNPMLGNGDINDLNDMDLNFMAEPWSESDDESPSTIEPINQTIHTNDSITQEQHHESPVAHEPSLLNGPPKDSDINSPISYNLTSNVNSPLTNIDLNNETNTNNVPPKGPPKDNEVVSPVTPNNQPLSGPPKDNEIVSPTMYSLSLGGTNPPPTNNSLYDTPKAPSSYTRGRKSRNKTKKFSNSQIGRFDKESENIHTSKKKEENKKTQITTETLVSSPVIAPANPGI